MPTEYRACLSPPQLFVGTTFHKSTYDEEKCEEEQEEYEDYWEQENIDISYQKVKEGVESLGIKCMHIEFGEYNKHEGTLSIDHIVCEYDPHTCNIPLETLLGDEAYITTGIYGYDFCRDYKQQSIGFYFMK